ncbi:MAG: N-acetylmuramoyl-L-alanine amidase [Ruminococcus sp.]|nr:N-acetylmuramoyl-L-alanine amidase [Ruminococcus sp.]
MMLNKFLAAGVAGCILCSAMTASVYAVSPDAGSMMELFADPEDYGCQVYAENQVPLPIYQATDESAESDEETAGEGEGESEEEVYVAVNEAIWNDTVRIMIDPGHAGYYNPSPVYSGYYESVMNWKLSNYLKEELEALGAEADLTKTSLEDDPDLIPRGKMSDGYDFFISMHSNAGSYSSMDAPLAICYQDVAWTNIDDISREIGTIMAAKVTEVMETYQEGELYQRLSVEDRDGNGVWDDEWYGVLCGARYVGTPGILLEHSFHTNYRATAWLSNDSNLQRMAKEEAAVIYEYFSELKVRERATATTTVGTTTTTEVTTTAPTETTATETTTVTTVPYTDPIPHEDWIAGDVDGDRLVSLSDATRALTYYAQYAAGLDPAFIQGEADEAEEALVFAAADMDGDGQIDLSDATEILYTYALFAVSGSADEAE